MSHANARITHLLLVLVLFALLAVIGMLATRSVAGPLDPPGSPSSTDGVLRPGTPISSLPFVTTGSGYYYLTRNLTGAVRPGSASTTTTSRSIWAASRSRARARRAPVSRR
jgi:hypothetical protein